MPAACPGRAPLTALCPGCHTAAHTAVDQTNVRYQTVMDRAGVASWALFVGRGVSFMRTRRGFLAAAAAGQCLLSACANVQVDEHSYQFNEATGSLGLRLLLLNAVRASKDYPLQFSKISAYQGTGTMGGSVSATMPLQLLSAGNVTPKVDWKDGLSQLTLIDLNTEEAQQALRKTVSYRVYEYYGKFRGSKSMAVVDIMMTEYIAISLPLHSLIKKRAEALCNDARVGNRKNLGFRLPAKVEFACNALDDLKKGCPEIYELNVGPGLTATLRNDLTNRCSFGAFMALVLQFDVVGVFPIPSSKEDKDKKSPESSRRMAGNTFNIYVAEQKEKENESDGKKTGNEQAQFLIVDKKFSEECQNDRSKICEPYKPNKSKPAIPNVVAIKGLEVQFRSPERMVRYLGELIAAQHFRPHRFVPEIIDTELRERFALFRVERGAPPPGGTAVAIRDPEGETFYVPKPSYGQPGADRSLEALAFVSDALNMAVSKKAFPQVTTFTVAPSP